MTAKHLSAAIAACLLCTQPVVADNRLEEVVVTSSRTPMPLREVGTSVSVISAADIRSRGYLTLPDIMRTQPAVGVTNYGGTGKVSTLNIRGEDGYRTRVYMDGIDISDTTSPQFTPPLGQMLSSGVERVEILRGPQGMMYGADAGGVVNITTRAPGEGFGGGLNAEGGRYGTRQWAGVVGWGGDTLDGNLSVTDMQTDGFNARSTDTDYRDDDGYSNTTVHARLGWQATGRLRITLVGRDVKGDNEYDDCYTQDYAPIDNCRDDYRQEAWRAAARWFGERFTHELSYSENSTRRAFYANGEKGDFAPSGELQRVSYLGHFRGGEALGLVYGADLETDSSEDAGVHESRDQDGYFLEAQGGWRDRLYLTAGGRYDDNDDYGDHTTWRVSGAWLIPATGGEVKLRSAYGTGFRAPSLYEVAYNQSEWANPPARGTSLDAEESEGWDAGVSWNGDDGLFLEVVYFDQSVDNLIQYDLVDYSGYLQESGKADSRGVELVAQVPLPADLSFTGNYTWNDARATDGSQRIYRPKHMANAGLDWRPLAGRLRLGVNARLSRDAVGIYGEALDNYLVVELHASYAMLAGLDVYGRVENLTDKDYQEAATYNTSGTAAYAGVRYTF